MRTMAIAILLNACGAPTPSPASVESSQGSEEGSEEVASAPAPPPELEAFLDAVLELDLAFELLDEHDRWARREDMRNAYGDGENCEGVCGLSVPSAGPEPEGLHREDFAELLDTLAGSVSSWSEPHWTAFATQLRVAANEARSNEDGIAAIAGQAHAALRTVTLERVSDEALCWLSTYTLTVASGELERMLVDIANELRLQAEIDYATDPDTDPSTEESDSVNDAISRVTPVLAEIEVLLRAGPTHVELAVQRLAQAQAIVEPELGEHAFADMERQLDALPTICGF